MINRSKISRSSFGMKLLFKVYYILNTTKWMVVFSLCLPWKCILQNTECDKNSNLHQQSTSPCRVRVVYNMACLWNFCHGLYNGLRATNLRVHVCMWKKILLCFDRAPVWVALFSGHKMSVFLEPGALVRKASSFSSNSGGTCEVIIFIVVFFFISFGGKSN